MLIRAVESYLEVRRAAGFELRVPEYLLRAYAGFAQEHGETHVRASTAIAWAALAPSLYQRDKRLRTVILFARYARAEDLAHDVPPEHVFAAPFARRRPHIFGCTDLKRIVQAAGQLRPHGDPLRPHTFQALFGLLAACGMRVSEALSLRLTDLTVDGLVIRKTKFHKSRLVPMHATTEAALKQYVERRLGLAGATEHLFVSRHGRQLPYSTAVATFLAVVRRLGLRGAPGKPGPHLHDLRHTFAVRALEACPREEVEAQALALATYLGHAHIAHTYWYLHATPQLMTGIADACQAHTPGRMA